jgi:hypothetical protein
VTVATATLQELQGRELPGGQLVIEPQEVFVGDEALRLSGDLDGALHPAWFVITSLRCMGISVQELCALMQQEDGDALLFGSCRVQQWTQLHFEKPYTSSARIGQVSSRTTRDGSRLDSVEVVIQLRDAATAADVGEVVSIYLLKRKTTG